MRLNKAWQFGQWELAVVFRGASFFSITIEKTLAERYDVQEILHSFRFSI